MRARIPCTSSKSNTTADCTARVLASLSPSSALSLSLSLSPRKKVSWMPIARCLINRPRRRTRRGAFLANPYYLLPSCTLLLALPRTSCARTSGFGEGNHFSAVFIPRRIARARVAGDCRTDIGLGIEVHLMPAVAAGHTLERGSKICTLSHHSLCIRSAVHVYSYVWMSQKSESLAVARCLHWLAGFAGPVGVRNHGWHPRPAESDGAPNSLQKWAWAVLLSAAAPMGESDFAELAEMALGR